MSVRSHRRRRRDLTRLQQYTRARARACVYTCVCTSVCTYVYARANARGTVGTCYRRPAVVSHKTKTHAYCTRIFFYYRVKKRSTAIFSSYLRRPLITIAPGRTGGCYRLRTKTERHIPIRHTSRTGFSTRRTDDSAVVFTRFWRTQLFRPTGRRLSRGYTIIIIMTVVYTSDGQ